MRRRALMGTWIEMAQSARDIGYLPRRALMGTWIEILL